ncbi:hypothetical protein [Helcococcus massiliensis]|uniref:hypothetical protein n=1 Tax=Helcococcus massiliensis TaxID=2040290 RepID=UPI000CDEF48F|nr:hypothetical protein [Helcococcus massiliensis]
MISIKQELIKYEKDLESIIRKLKDRPKFNLDGHIKIDKSRKKVAYKHVKNNKYIKTLSSDDQSTIKSYFQSNYENKVYKKAKKLLPLIKRLNKIYQDDSIDSIYDNLDPIKKSIVKPIRKTKKQIAEEWMTEGFKTLAMPKEEFRSKSEYIIASKLKNKSIPFKYEKELFLHNYGRVYPDFTIFDPNTNKEIYWEHFGMMDDIEYRDKTYRKIQAYLDNGYLPGINFIMTFESNSKPLNYKLVDKMISEYFG